MQGLQERYGQMKQKDIPKHHLLSSRAKQYLYLLSASDTKQQYFFFLKEKEYGKSCTLWIMRIKCIIIISW